MKEALATAKEKWRAKFILQRRLMYQEASVMDQSGNTEADYSKEWREEQQELNWIYGDRLISLFEIHP